MESLLLGNESARGGKTAYPDWQTALAGAVRDPAELCGRLGLSRAVSEAAAGACGQFPLLVPREYLSRIRPGEPDDPLLLQILPRQAELLVAPGFSTDPVEEAHDRGAPGLLAKYRGRALMLTTGACGVHCRFCFRRHFPHADASTTAQAWDRALRQIRSDRSIREVILSGGDPLALDDRRLAELAERLAEIGHLRRMRIHTRLPIVIPQRVNDQLISWLRGGRLAPLMVVHINHPAEVDDAVATALQRLVDAGIPVLSQSVLLRGVNDRIETLHALYERLADLRVLPYYLHQLDRVAGAAHFEVPEEAGRRLIEQLRARLPGYAVPRYVCEVPGRASKQVLA
jgi:EF-P beta-lysylation protein EpmB